MANLYNLQKKEFEQVPDNQAAQALSSGGYDIESGVHNMVGEDGQAFGVDSGDVLQSLNDGNRFETPKEADVRKYRDENSGIKGDLKQVGQSFGNQFSLGALEAGQDALQSPEDKAKRAALAEDHPFSAAFGGVGGFAASMGVGTGELGLGKGLLELGAKGAEHLIPAALNQGEQTLAKTLAKKAIIGGVEGAALAAPSVITEASLGDPREAAENLMMNVGFGGALNTALPLAKAIPGFNKLIEGGSKAKAFVSESIDKLLNSPANEWFGNVKFDTKSNDAVNYGKQLLDESGAYTSKSKFLDVIKDNGKTLEKEVQSGLNLADAQNADKTFSSSNLKSDELNNFIDPYKNFGDAPAGTAKSQLSRISEIQDQLNLKIPKDGVLTTAQARKLATEYGDQINWRNPDASYVNEFLIDLRQKLRSGVVETWENVSNGAENLSASQKDSLAGYNDSMKEYSNNINLEKMFTKSVQKEMNQSALGFKSLLTGDVLSHATGGGVPGLVTGIIGKKVWDRFGYQTLIQLAKSKKIMGTAIQDGADVLAKSKAFSDSSLKNVKTAGLIDLANHISGNDEHKSLADAYFTVNDALNQSSDSSHLMDGVTHLSKNFNNDQTKDIAQAYAMSLGNALGHLKSVMPQVSTPISGFPQDNKGKNRSRPSDMQLKDLDKRVGALINPLQSIKNISTGNGHSGEQDTLKTVYPMLYNNYTGSISNNVMNSNKSFNPTSKNNINKAIGYNISNQNNNTSLFQNVYSSRLNSERSPGMPKMKMENSINNRMGGTESILKRSK